MFVFFGGFSAHKNSAGNSAIGYTAQVCLTVCQPCQFFVDTLHAHWLSLSCKLCKLIELQALLRLLLTFRHGWLLPSSERLFGQSEVSAKAAAVAETSTHWLTKVVIRWIYVKAALFDYCFNLFKDVSLPSVTS